MVCVEFRNHWGEKIKLKGFEDTWSFIPVAIVVVGGMEKVFNLTLLNFSLNINFSV